MPAPEKFDNVSVFTKANLYFGGRVVSHTVQFADGSKKTLGLIYEGSFNFGTQKSEIMEIVAGSCRVKQKGENEFKAYESGQAFQVPANSAFDIVVGNGVLEYVCSYVG